MKEYHKIQTVFKRDTATKNKTLIAGEYSTQALKYLADNEWIFTEKIDGTNIRVKLSGISVLFAGKTDNSQIPAHLFTKLTSLFPADKMLEVFPESDICLYGEGYGAKIQKGGGDYIPDGCNFILFDVKIGDLFLERENVEDVANKLGIYVVPLIGRGKLSEAVSLAREGFESGVGDCFAEGLVMRPKTELFDRSGHRIITKIKHKDFPQTA